MSPYPAREIPAYTTEQNGTMHVMVTGRPPTPVMVRRLEPTISADVALDHQPLVGFPIGF